MDFAELISSSRGYLAQFDYDHYPANADAFAAKAEPYFLSLEGADLTAAAEEALNALERGREGLRRREQKLAAEEEKKVLALFFSPMAIRRGGAAAEFALLLCQRWKERYPRDAYLTGTYEELMRGFDANLLGLPLRKSAFLWRREKP